MQKRIPKSALAIAAAVFLCVGVGLWLHYYLNLSDPALDYPMRNTLSKISSITSYAQTVETETIVDNRRLNITGFYTVDNDKKEYASFSTTTLYIGADPRPHVFAHQNIAIGNDVFLKIETADPVLKSSIQSSPNWQTFKSNAIPKNLSNVAIAGPLQDNLVVMTQNGTYLRLVAQVGPVMWEQEGLLRYTFTLSPKAFAVGDGPLNSIAGRVGRTGTVDIWIDPKTDTVRHLVFSNAPYFSTTTISNINIPLPLTPPIAPKS